MYIGTALLTRLSALPSRRMNLAFLVLRFGQTSPRSNFLQAALAGDLLFSFPLIYGSIRFHHQLA